jgi:predicted porin
VNSQAAAARGAAFNQIDSQAGISSNSSNIGFRGSEDLGGGWKAIFQLESAINLDAGNGNLGSRNSNLGLSSGWGTVFYGVWDTPYKIASGKPDPFYATTAASFNSVYGSPGFNSASSGTNVNTPTYGAGASLANLQTDANFDRRQGNSVQYWTPDFAGFSARFMYSPGEQKSNQAIDTNAVLGTRIANLNPYIWSALAMYDNGPIYAAAAYEQHNDYFGTRLMTGTTALGESSKDWGAKGVIGAQNLWGFSIYGIFERLSYSTNGLVTTGLVNNWKRNAYGVMGTYGLGNFTFRAGWMTANDGSCSTVVGFTLATNQVCNADNTGTNQYSAGVAYSFSKRTQVFVYYTRQDNDANSRYRYGTNTGPVGSNVAIGAVPQAAGLGIRHTF